MMRAQAMLSLPDAAVYPEAGMWRMDGGGEIGWRSVGANWPTGGGGGENILVVWWFEF